MGLARPKDIIVDRSQFTPDRLGRGMGLKFLGAEFKRFLHLVEELAVELMLATQGLCHRLFHLGSSAESLFLELVLLFFELPVLFFEQLFLDFQETVFVFQLLFLGLPFPLELQQQMRPEFCFHARSGADMLLRPGR